MMKERPRQRSFLYKKVIVAFSEGLTERFHLIRINMALADLDLSEGASCQITAEHLQLRRELFLRQAAFLPKLREMRAETF